MMKAEPVGGPAGPQQTANDDFPWWVKYGVKFFGVVTSLAALAFGVMACITLSPGCLLAGIIQMLCGVFIALIEAPFLCMFLDFAQVPSAYFDGKPPWMRGLVYIVISIIPLTLCQGFSILFGAGLIFVTGSLYGLISLKKKAPLQEMRMQASSSYNLLQNSRGGTDVERGMGQNFGDPAKAAGVI